MNKAEFKEIVTGLKTMFGDKIPEMSGFVRDVWYEALSDLDFETAKKAVINHIKTSKYAPSVADIREQYDLIMDKRRKYYDELEEIFNDMKCYYPNGDKDIDAMSCYLFVISDMTVEERMDKAKKLRDKVVCYIKDCESGKCNLNMSLSQCITQMGKKL